MVEYGIYGIGGVYTGAVFDLKHGKIIIGRDPKISNIVLYGEKISRKHCEIVYDQNSGEYMVTDYSQNGVYLGNGKRLKKDTRTLVKRYSLLYIATPENSFILL